MDKYTIYCTKEQTKKALELGAPLELYSEEYDNSNIKDNEFYITNDIIFMNNENICRNEEFDLVCIIGKEPNRKAYFVPTAEQMISWLEEQDNINYITISNTGDYWYYDINTIDNTLFLGNLYCGSRKEATLAAIDSALEYLSKNKNK